MLSWIQHLQRLKECVPLGVPTVVVQTCANNQRRSWVNIFARMDSRQTKPVASTMVKLIVRETRLCERIEDYDADAGVGDMSNDYHEAHFDE